MRPTNSILTGASNLSYYAVLQTEVSDIDNRFLKNCLRYLFGILLVNLKWHILKAILSIKIKGE